MPKTKSHTFAEVPRRAHLKSKGTSILIDLEKTVLPEGSEPASCGGIKKHMEGFSGKSRLNFARAMSATEWPDQPSHVTLTYGKLKPDQVGKYYKQDLKALEKWFRLRGVVGFWRLEFQERKQSCLDFLSLCSSISESQLSHLAQYRRAAHFHCLLIGFTEAHERQLRLFWQKRTRCHIKYGVTVTQKESGKASWYLALHGQKNQQAPNISVGRWWGYFGADQMKAYQVETNYGELSEHLEVRLRRILRRYLRKKSFGKRNSVTVFMSKLTQQKLIHYLYTLENTAEELRNNRVSILEKNAAMATAYLEQPF